MGHGRLNRSHSTANRISDQAIVEELKKHSRSYNTIQRLGSNTGASKGFLERRLPRLQEMGVIQFDVGFRNIEVIGELPMRQPEKPPKVKKPEPTPQPTYQPKRPTRTEDRHMASAPQPRFRQTKAEPVRPTPDPIPEPVVVPKPVDAPKPDSVKDIPTPPPSTPKPDPKPIVTPKPETKPVKITETVPVGTKMSFKDFMQEVASHPDANLEDKLNKEEISVLNHSFGSPDFYFARSLHFNVIEKNVPFHRNRTSDILGRLKEKGAIEQDQQWYFLTPEAFSFLEHNPKKAGLISNKDIAISNLLNALPVNHDSKLYRIVQNLGLGVNRNVVLDQIDALSEYVYTVNLDQDKGYGLTEFGQDQRFVLNEIRKQANNPACKKYGVVSLINIERIINKDMLKQKVEELGGKVSADKKLIRFLRIAAQIPERDDGKLYYIDLVRKQGLLDKSKVDAGIKAAKKLLGDSFEIIYPADHDKPKADESKDDVLTSYDKPEEPKEDAKNAYQKPRMRPGDVIIPKESYACLEAAVELAKEIGEEVGEGSDLQTKVMELCGKIGKALDGVYPYCQQTSNIIGNLTKTESNLVRKLSAEKYLSARQIGTSAGLSPQYISQKMRDLEGKGFVESINLPRPKGKISRPEKGYLLTEKAIIELKDAGKDL